MAGTDVYQNVAVPSTNWSSTAIYVPQAGSTPPQVQAGIVAASDCVLSGTVSQIGDTITLSVPGQSGFEEQISAVADTYGGALFVDDSGNYIYFSSEAVFEGAYYPIVPGFGYFSSAVPCFAAGTLIATPTGYVEIQNLRRGDVVRTIIGTGSAAVIWTGHRHVLCGLHPYPKSVWPIRIAAHAFSRGRPSRDLYISPEHAVFVDGVLVPARLLVNDATIVQVERDAIEYWHVELSSHNVIFANDMPAESYLETGSRNFLLDSKAEIESFGGDSVLTVQHKLKTHRCARLLVDEYEVADLGRALRQLASKMGHAESSDAQLGISSDCLDLQYSWDGKTLKAKLPCWTSNIYLNSRSSVPTRQFLGSKDSRRLGVAVTRILLDGVEIPLDDQSLQEGWHQTESGLRWTCGAATIVLQNFYHTADLEVWTLPMLRYWTQPAARPSAGWQTVLEGHREVRGLHTPALGHLDVLAGDDGGRRACLAARPSAVEHHQTVVDRFTPRA